MNRSKLDVASLLIVALLVSFGCHSERPRPADEIKVTKPTAYDLTSVNMPFSPICNIILNVPECMPAKVTVYNVMGESIGVLLDSTICGYLELNVMYPRKVSRRLSGLPDSYYYGAQTSGIYFYSAEFPDTTVSRKMIVLR